MQGFNWLETRHCRAWPLFTALLCVHLSGCASSSSARSVDGVYQQTLNDGPGQLSLLDTGSSETPRNLPKSRSGNRSAYQVFGKTYRVMDTARGYQERGGASWYGSKFHGRKTSSGEIYNMYDMTAAHKSLPLPTFAKVTNLANNRTIVVKINDRGPFHAQRIIDLSYAAAAQLDMLDTGTAQVEVTAISEHVVEGLDENKPKVSDTASAKVGVTENIASTPARSEVTRVVQVGAFSEISNAQNMQTKVNEAMQVSAAYIVAPEHSQFYKVRFKVAGSASIHDIFDQLERFGINNYRVIE